MKRIALLCLVVLGCCLLLAPAIAMPPGSYDSEYQAQGGQWVRARITMGSNSGTYSTASFMGRLVIDENNGDSVIGRWMVGQKWGEFRFNTQDGWQTFNGHWNWDPASGPPRAYNWTGRRLSP